MSKNFSIVFVLFIVGICSGQSSYNFSVSNEPYINLVNSTSLNNGAVWDDPEYQFPIGFDLQIDAYIINQLFLPEGGLGGIISTLNTLDSGSGGYLIPVGQDIFDRGDLMGGSLSNISYKLEGAVGNGILKIEYNNVGFFDDGTTQDFMNFQVWLYENTNIVEYRFGASQINNPSGSFEGLPGLSVAFFPSIDNDNEIILSTAYLLYGEPANPTITEISPGGDGDDFALNGMPLIGTVYRFTPEILSIGDNISSKIIIVPNPTSDMFSLNTNEKFKSLKLYNELGQQVASFNPQNRNHKIDDLPNGLYFLKIQTDEGVQTKKIIKK